MNQNVRQSIALLLLVLLSAQPLCVGGQPPASVLRETRPATHQRKIAVDLEDEIERAEDDGDETTHRRMVLQFNDASSRVALRTKLLRRGGRNLQWHEAAGSLTVELPLSAARQLAADSDIAYVSPDRPVFSTGHLEAATAARQIRNLVNGTTLDGRGIGIAILDSGLDDSHLLTKSSTGHPGMVAHEDFVGSDAVKDRFGHGTHVATMAAGMRKA